MDYSDLKKLKVYFFALKKSNYHPKLIPNSIVMDGALTPTYKPRCLELLRSFPDLKGKDDNQIFEVLSNPNKVKSILGQLTSPLQRNELTEVLEEKPVTIAEVSEQPSGQGVPPSGQETQPAGAATSTSFGGIGFPSVSSSSRIIHNIPRAPSEPETPSSKLSRRFNFRGFKIPSSLKTFGSNAGISFRKYSGKIAGGLGQIAGEVGRNVLGPGLSSVYNQGARAVLGGSNTFSRISSQARRRIASVKSRVPKPSGKSGAKIFAGGLLAMFLFMFVSGMIAGITGTTGGNTPGTSPIAGTSTDISSCKFTRAGSSQLVKSSALQGLISSAAVSAGIPAPVLASVAMHESPNLVANADNNHDAIKSGQYCNYGQTICINKENTGTLYDGACLAEDIAKGAKTAQAVGLMQNIDIYNQGKGDLCNISNSLAIAAAKLKGDGVTLQPTQEQITTGVTHHYNACKYDGGDYCKEVWQDLQNCQTQQTGPIAVGPEAPPLSGSLEEKRTKIKEQFKINFQINGLDEATYSNVLDWSWQTLNLAAYRAPNFLTLLWSHIKNPKKIVTINGTDSFSNRSGDVINLSRKEGSTLRNNDKFFKQNFIHELAHIINDGQPGTYGTAIKSVIADEGKYMTKYAAGATPGDNHDICAAGSYEDARADEDFSEMVSYYINITISEQDYSSSCGIVPSGNPFIRNGEPNLPLHYQYAQVVLGTPRQ